MTVIDLKSIVYFSHSVSKNLPGVANVYWKNYLLSNNGFLTHA